MTAKAILALIWEWYECEKFQAFWGFLSFMGYTKHIHAALAISWVVVSSKPHETFVLPSSIFLSQSSNSAVCSTLSVAMWIQCLLPHMELISIDAISSVRIKSLIFSPVLAWSRSRGWMPTKAINHRHRVPPPLKPIWKFPHLYTISQNHVWGKHKHGTESPSYSPSLCCSQNCAHHLFLPILKMVVTPELGCCHGADQAKHSKGTPGRWSWLSWQPQNQHSHALTFSTLLNHNFTILQDHKKKRMWERKEKYEQEH